MIKNLINKFKHMGENDKIVYRNVLFAFIVKGGALFVSLFTLPAYIKFFNNDETLGFWYTVLSLLNWILNFDLGIGNGLRNHLSKSLTDNNKDETKKLISSSYLSVGIITILLSVIFVFVSKFIDFNAILNIDTSIVNREAMLITINIVFIGVMVQFLLKLVNSIIYALQLSSINNFLVLCTNVMILLCALFIPSGDNNQNAIVMSIVHAVAVALPLLISTIAIFAKKLRYALPRFINFTKEHSKKVLSLGGLFFVIQIAYMLIMSSNEFLISATAGNPMVVDYQAYYKLFSLTGTIFALALTPLWSTITKAKTENNFIWIKKTFKRFFVFGLLFCLANFLLILLMKPVMIIWLGADAIPNISYLTGLLFSLLSSGLILNSVLSTFSNGLGEIKTQAYCFIIGAIAKIPLSFLLYNLMGTYEAVVLANVICLIPYCIIQPIVFKKRFN